MLTPTAAEDDHGHAAHPAPAHGLTRRRLLRACAAAGGGVLWAGMPALAQTPPLRPTADDALGPFYPLTLPADQDFDLTRLAGQAGAAQGQLLHVSGRVLTPDGAPVVGAIVEVWQANSVGRYAHPGDHNAAPLDPNFQGYARLRTGADGSYRLKTVKPGEYPGRTPHIHFAVRGARSRLVTQMYFEGEARNATDGLLSRRSPAARQTLVARYVAPSGAQEKTALAAQWDIVLAVG